MEKKTAKYGIFIGRFQPFHLGHEYTIQKILEDGLTPALFLGSANESGTEKNPHSFSKRIKMIRSVYPDTNIFPLVDSYSNDIWMDGIREAIAMLTDDPSEVVFYTHNKPEDRYDFVYKGETYTNEHYSKIFEVEGYTVKVVEVSDIPISGTAIRAKLETNKKYLRASVIEILEEG